MRDRSPLKLQMTVCIIGGLFLSGLFCPWTAAAEGVLPRGSSLSMDDMLDYTLTDLRGRMQNVAGENTKLSERNNALRKRIMTLRQEVRNLENRKIELLEEAVGLSDEIKLNARELAIGEKRDESRQKGENYLAQDLRRLQEQFDQSKSEGEDLRRQVGDLTEELQGIRRDHDRRHADVKKEKFDGERYGLVQEMAEVQERIYRQQKELAGLKNRLRGAEPKHIQQQQDQQSLQRDLAGLQEEWRTLSNETELLSSHAEKLGEQKQADLQQAEEENMRLKMYAQALVSAMSELQEANRKIEAQTAQQIPQLRKYLSMLQQERQLLADRQKFLEMVLSGYRDIKSRWQTKLSASGDDGLQQRMDALNEELARMNSQVEQQQLTQVDLAKREDTLKEDIRQMKEQLRSLFRIPAGSKQKQAYRQNAQKAEIARLQQRHQSSQREVGRLRTLAETARQNLATAQQRRAALVQDLATMRGDLEAAEAVLEETRQAKDAMTTDPYDQTAIAQIKADIESLKMRDTVLTSSLTVVKSKYTADDLAVQEFSRDENSLREYLKLLQQENASLKLKLSGLDESIDQWQTQPEVLDPASFFPGAEAEELQMPEVEEDSLDIPPAAKETAPTP